LIRLEELDNYYKEFNFAFLPNATLTTAVGVGVTSEERIEVPSWSYESWVVETSRGFRAGLWVSKKERIVAKLVEDNTTYVLQQARYW
jgi:hypothetical protein